MNKSFQNLQANERLSSDFTEDTFKYVLKIINLLLETFHKL